MTLLRSAGESATDVESPAALYDVQILSLRNMLVHLQPVTYRLFFDAFTHVANEQDNYVLQLEIVARTTPLEMRVRVRED